MMNCNAQIQVFRKEDTYKRGQYGFRQCSRKAAIEGLCTFHFQLVIQRRKHGKSETG